MFTVDVKQQCNKAMPSGLYYPYYLNESSNRCTAHQCWLMTNIGLVLYNHANFYRFEKTSRYLSVKRKKKLLQSHANSVDLDQTTRLDASVLFEALDIIGLTRKFDYLKVERSTVSKNKGPVSHY